MFGKLRDSWVVWRRKVGEILHAHSETLEDYGDKLDTYNPVEKTEDMSTPVGVDNEGKLWTSGGGSGETREPLFSFDVVAETPYQMSRSNSADFMNNSMILDVYVVNTLFHLTESEKDGTTLTMHFYPDEGDDEVIFTVDTSGANRTTVTSSISGSLIAYTNFEHPLVIYGEYSSDVITLSGQPAEVILGTIIGAEGLVSILYVMGSRERAQGYLTASQYMNGSTSVFAISSDVDINGKFTFSVDNGYIKGVHQSS